MDRIDSMIKPNLQECFKTLGTERTAQIIQCWILSYIVALIVMIGISGMMTSGEIVAEHRFDCARHYRVLNESDLSWRCRIDMVFLQSYVDAAYPEGHTHPETMGLYMIILHFVFLCIGPIVLLVYELTRMGKIHERREQRYYKKQT